MAGNFVEEWRGGFPAARGWYDCMIDGERLKLLHFVCDLSGRHEWVTPAGDYVTDCGVVWRGDPVPGPGPGVIR